MEIGNRSENHALLVVGRIRRLVHILRAYTSPGTRLA